MEVLIAVFVGLGIYAFLPSRWKKNILIKLGILIPVTVLIVVDQLYTNTSWQQLGIRTDDWWAGARPVFIFTAFAAVIIGLAAEMRNRLTWNTNMNIAAVLYPLFGCLQQFLIISFINTKLMALGWSTIEIAEVTALAFLCLHVPNRWLMGPSIAIGFFYSLLFQSNPNVIALGISHGFLGMLWYFWVMPKEMDPIEDIKKQLGLKKS